MRVFTLTLLTVAISAVPSLAFACHASPNISSAQAHCSPAQHRAYHSVPRDHSHPHMQSAKAIAVMAPSSFAVSREQGVIIHRGATPRLPDYNAVVRNQARQDRRDARRARADAARANARADRAQTQARLARIEADIARQNYTGQGADFGYDYGYGRRGSAGFLGNGGGLILPGGGLIGGRAIGGRAVKGRSVKGRGAKGRAATGRSRQGPSLRAGFGRSNAVIGTGRGNGALTR